MVPVPQGSGGSAAALGTLVGKTPAAQSTTGPRGGLCRGADVRSGRGCAAAGGGALPGTGRRVHRVSQKRVWGRSGWLRRRFLWQTRCAVRPHCREALLGPTPSQGQRNPLLVSLGRHGGGYYGVAPRSPARRPLHTISNNTPPPPPRPQFWRLELPERAALSRNVAVFGGHSVS